ncbi:MAG: putative ethyl tert-butyl ether degradation protein [Modestobacter sp.]|nr:putative ethyl tert-butyl ether degradation protein [Modestobacter sp.]
MHTLMVLYRPPADRAAFDRHYEQIHLPLARELPGVRAARYSLDVAAEGDPAFTAVFEADFDSAEDMAAALASPAGAAAQADIPNFATGGLEILHFPARTS